MQFIHRFCLLFLFWVTLFVSSGLHGQDEAEPKKFFLPKSATAAAYMLNRLSNKELIEAPRSEFVYVALLQRKGLDRKYRLEAIEGLVKNRGSDSVTEIIQGIRVLDKKGEEQEPVLRDLALLLLQRKSPDLSAKKSALEALEQDAQLPLTRQIALAAQVAAAGSGDAVWKQLESDPSRLAALILSIPLISDAPLRSSFYPRIFPLLKTSAQPEIQRAAITAYSSMPGKETEIFQTLSGLFLAGTEPNLAVAGLQRLPRKTWPKEQSGALFEGLLKHLQNVPASQRTEAEFVQAFQFATELATLLPPEKARSGGKILRSLGVAVFTIRALSEQMLYDKTLIVVEAGKPVELILINDDGMPHNLVVVTPGSIEEVGEAAEKMKPEPDALGRIHVPANPKVLFATPMIEAGQQGKLAFTAPEEPGDYGYVCTFPGHWRRMIGTLAVVKDVEAYLSSRANVVEPVATEWKVEDLAPDLEKSGSPRNIENGRALFTSLACAQCHQLGAVGYGYGPELSSVFKRYQNKSSEVLLQILEPSLVISNRYQNVQFELKNGESASGMVVKEDAGSVTIQSGPSDLLIQTIKTADVEKRQPQTSSLMPAGLLNMLSKQQILDLFFYMESASGSTHSHAH